jgi:hypothetical protein
MNRWIIYLGICLLAQVALAISVNLAQTDYSAFKPMETLLSFDAKMVDDILIEQDDEQRVKLKKLEERWNVFSMNNFQADKDKVEAFLDKLAELKKGWPVATTNTAAKRFKVAENNFERKITLSKEGKNIDTLFIGTSPGFRKIHARRNDEDSIYAVNFNDYEAGTRHEDWIDKGVLTHKTSEILRVQLPDFSLLRQDENLIVEGIDASTEDTVAEEADRLVRKIADLRIRTVLGIDAKPEYNQDNPVFRYTLVLSSGDSEEYVFSKPKDADDYVLKPSHCEEYFKVDNWVVDSLMEIDRSKLVRKKDDEKKPKKKENSTKNK